MCCFRAHRHLLIGMASWVFLLATLLPSVAQAWPAAGGWGSICSAASDGGSAPADPAAGHVLEHCPYCAAHAHSVGLPPSPTAWSPPILSWRHAMPAAFWAAPRTLAVWRTAQPRGPPTLS